MIKKNGQDYYEQAFITPVENINRSFPGKIVYGRP